MTLLLFEILFGSIDESLLTPFGADRLTDSRGGAVRLQGLYADLGNYSYHLNGVFFIITYFRLTNHFPEKST